MGDLAKRDFSLEGIVYQDKTLGITISLVVRGHIEFTCEADAETAKKTSDELITNFLAVLNMLSEAGTGYEELPAQDYLPFMKEMFDHDPELAAELEIISYKILEIHPAEEDYARILQARRERAAHTPESEVERAQEPEQPISASTPAPTPIPAPTPAPASAAVRRPWAM